MKNKLCQHRHTEESHPACFNKQWYADLKVGYLDIEASDLNANSAWMLSWAICGRDSRGKKYRTLAYDYASYEDMFKSPGVVNRDYDRRIIQSLIQEMKQYDVLVTYYGTGFDIPFIRTRAMILKEKFIKPKTIAHIDLYYHVRGKMSLNRNSLAMATKCLNIDGKTHLDFAYWKLAAMGDVKAMEELITHNTEDVKILDDLHLELENVVNFKKSAYV